MSFNPAKAVTAWMQEFILFVVFQARCHTVSRGRDMTLTRRVTSSRSVWRHWARGFTERHAAPVDGGPLSGRKLVVEKLWREFFSNPSQWWDNRAGKVNSRYPDFKHKKTEQPLWLDSNLTPPWVQAELAAMVPGTLQSDISSWNVRLQRYSKSGNYKDTVELYQQLLQEGLDPNKFTFIPVLNACARLGALEGGRRIHTQIMQSGLELDVYLASCLLDMYAKCGSIEDAWRVFKKMPSRDVVSWTAMILGYVKCGQGHKALGLFRQMFADGVEPDPTTFVGVLNACASVNALEEGRLVHEQISRRGYESNVFVACSLVNMYAKCGAIEDAQRVFSKMPLRDVVSWNAMILGYVKCGGGQMALELSRQMCAEGVEPDATTFVGLLTACASVAALEEGKLVHKQISKRGYESDIFVASSLIDMYAKCGSIEDSQKVFNKMAIRDVISWNTMLAGYAMHGRAKDAFEYFERMCQIEVEADGVTFGCLLSSCSHGGLAEEGLHYFELMIDVYKVSPTMEHYACVVDLLGRAGHLHEAEDFIRSMPCEPGAIVWMSLLGACRIHGNLDAGERVKRILELEPTDASGYVLL